MMNKLQIFTKAPIAGFVKTRLTPPYSPDEAVQLHKRLIQNCLCQFTPHFSVELWCAPDTQHPFFQHCQQQYALNLRIQQGQTLGERMFNALKSNLPAITVLIGTDSPSLQVDDINKAFNVLEQGYPIVFAPAEDGGYALVGLRDAPIDVFTAMRWSHAEVMADTRIRLRHLQREWYELPLQWDVDRPEDVKRWQQCSVPAYFSHPTFD
ncbi:TIGR04282 family arsenosugar biosynthesis glycosyltransferase [Beggiatoa leptomitoformis]|uniref:DUF2064 domain-containing protein n=1 Tax=Beggiatoa leptomitoformis TaxID=288004 RepID=A0A2N9YCP1_9GAMM|nr:TIGR04282 family arsenosugar biosynthesis glycosyltransferase [Beggiatoa leptomitoformis]ALG66519.1 DUF2064 domain-containing protein [Beggiatoa leptomitoformis]AUI68184.1 DUF2064 domain-containing protein [Beggiatoa leptomitoformis]